MVRIVGLLAVVAVVLAGSAQAQDRRVGFERIRAQWDEPWSVQRLELLADGTARLEDREDGKPVLRLVGKVPATLLQAIDDARQALMLRGHLARNFGRGAGSVRGVRVQTTHPGQPGQVLEGGVEVWVLRATAAQDRYLKLLAQVRTSVAWSPAVLSSSGGGRSGGLLGRIAEGTGARTSGERTTSPAPRPSSAPGVHVAGRRRR